MFYFLFEVLSKKREFSMNYRSRRLPSIKIGVTFLGSCWEVLEERSGKPLKVRTFLGNRKGSIGRFFMIC